ncbi:MAG: dihydropyrimidine dehydrogenase, partial [Hyphomicrobiales bacterium]|nr:dihydropyrimidine dehydrogenase [Hyphomicrobiales bacterium]
MPDIKAGRLDGTALNVNFSDMLPGFARNDARVAAERCLFCHDAPCVKACPTSIDIPLFIRQIAAQNPIGAARTILDQNIMGAMCARVCPTENLCEGVCVREVSEGKAIEIGRLQRYATDAAFEAGRQF